MNIKRNNETMQHSIFLLFISVILCIQPISSSAESGELFYLLYELTVTVEQFNDLVEIGQNRTSWWVFPANKSKQL